jgi:hypothetical protein
MAAGWEEYEWRWRTPRMSAARRDFIQPQWQGEAGEGRRLLIHAEQGFGDTLQFCRYAPMAAARGWRVLLEVQAPLVRLLQCLPGVEVVGQGETLPAFDAHIALLSLPRIFATRIDTIPAASPYLRANVAGEEAWRARLADIPGKRVGLAWAGSPLLLADRQRSVPPRALAPLFAVEGWYFVSLQKTGPAAPAEFPLHDFMADAEDFADTAALIANLDLVIAVDSAVAHLAAAMGKPVWLLNRFAPCWRWFGRREDSPWYPTLRIHQQPVPDDWDSVVAEVTLALRGWR